MSQTSQKGMNTLPKSIQYIVSQTLPKLCPKDQKLFQKTLLLSSKPPIIPNTSSNPPTLILTALSLSLQNLLLPLRHTTHTFLSSNRSSSEYNLYLQSISHIPFRSPESTRSVKSILAFIDHLNQLSHPPPISISTSTYTRLIRPSFTPIALLGYLHNRLTVLDPVPFPILLSFLTTYSKLSDPDNSSLFFSLIKAHPDTTPHSLHYASTLLLSAQQSKKAAYNVLTSPISKSNSYQSYNSSASLHVLSKDLSVPSRKLVRSFLLITRSPSLPNPPFLLLYTSLINGLILRKRYRWASVFFDRLIKLLKNHDRLFIDIPALAAGINALTRSGNPHHAFRLLESYYPSLIPSSSAIVPILTLLTAFNRISRPDLTTLLFFLYPTLYPSSPPSNSHMLNILIQAGRLGFKMDLNTQKGTDDVPDHVKRLLRYFHANSRSSLKHSNKSALNFVLAKLNLRTSNFIHQITESLGKNLGFQHVISIPPLPPFGRQPKPGQSFASHPHPRLAACNLILTHLGHPSRGGLRQFISSSAYQGLSSSTWARIVFLRVLAGVGAQMPLQPLSNIKPPAVSYIYFPHPPPTDHKSSPKLDSFTHLFSQYPKQELRPYTPIHFQNPILWENLLHRPKQQKSEKSTARQPFYPSIIPTNSNFFNYFLLVALHQGGRGGGGAVKLFSDGRVVPITTTTTTEEEEEDCPILPPASSLEIPLALAWMRTLEIQPSKSTLAVALVLWGEICARMDGQGRASTTATTSGRNIGEGEYVALVSYLRDWVGEKRLPHWRTLEKWRGLVKRMRGGIVGGGEEEEEFEEG